MNTKALSKQIGAFFRLRPQPLRVDGAGIRLQSSDDKWRLDEVTENPATLHLSNAATGHSLVLEWDNVLERRSPDFLMLRCQLTLRPRAVEIEPIHKGAPIRPTPVSLLSLEQDAAKVPMLSRGAIWKTFDGILVTCQGRLGSLVPLESGRMRVGIIGDKIADFYFEIDPADYPRLLTARGDERIQAIGAYRSNVWGHWFDEAELSFLS